MKPAGVKVHDAQMLTQMFKSVNWSFIHSINDSINQSIS